eukprot:TRINITY_DN565_c0_g1_i2.p1 TRINITY_DN565_c0_g1~~TRINITY_DN565_c0_g1_i2.p1  ORF type:complete len:575 (+),score=186.22 TRINITY_DN565_c0_g1_i2:107-1726(+)
MEHDSIEAPLSSASFLLQRSDRFLSRLRIFEQKLGRISRLTRKTISRKGSVEYPVLLADAEVYWMEFEVAWKTYFEEYDVLMRDAKHLIGSGYIDSSQAMMIEDAVEACSHRVSTCQSLMGKTMRLIGSVRRIASSKGVQHNPVVDLLRDFRLRAFSPKRPRPNRRRELRPPPTPATSSRTLVKQQLRKLHEHEREETRASGGNHHTRHGKWVVRDADLVEGDDESPRKSTSVRRMRRDRGRIRSEDEANEAYDTYRPLDRETGRHAVGAEVIDRYLSQSDRDRVHGIQHGRKRQVRRQDDHETLSEKWNERDHVRVDDASDDKEEEEEEEEEEEGDNEDADADDDIAEGGAATAAGGEEGKELSFMKPGGKDEDEEHRKTIKKVGGSGVAGPESTPSSSPSAPAGSISSALARVQAAVNLRLKGKQMAVPTPQEEVFQSRYELNDYPQFVRWRVLQKGNIEDLQELTGCALTSKGEHIPSNAQLQPGQEKLYVLIEGPTEEAVLSARKEIQETIEKAQQVLAQQAERSGQHQGGRYAV